MVSDVTEPELKLKLARTAGHETLFDECFWKREEVLRENFRTRCSPTSDHVSRGSSSSALFHLATRLNKYKLWKERISTLDVCSNERSLLGVNCQLTVPSCLSPQHESFGNIWDDEHICGPPVIMVKAASDPAQPHKHDGIESELGLVQSTQCESLRVTTPRHIPNCPVGPSPSAPPFPTCNHGSL